MSKRAPTDAQGSVDDRVGAADEAEVARRRSWKLHKLHNEANTTAESWRLSTYFISKCAIESNFLLD